MREHGKQLIGKMPYKSLSECMRNVRKRVENGNIFYGGLSSPKAHSLNPALRIERNFK